MNCTYCNDEIRSTRNAYRRIRGWEQPRSAGGTNHVAGREQLDEWACIHCINRLKRGVVPGQATLL